MDQCSSYSTSMKYERKRNYRKCSISKGVQFPAAEMPLIKLIAVANNFGNHP